MRTKDKIIFFGQIFLGAAIFVATTLFFGLRLYQKGGDIAEFGYIPENQTPVIRWVEKVPGLYYMDPEILVVTEKGDTIIVKAKENFSGSFMVLNKDTYPPSRGVKVFVRMKKTGEEIVIKDASLKPFEK